MFFVLIQAFQDVVKKHSVLKKKIQRIMSYENALQQIKVLFIFQLSVTTCFFCLFIAFAFHFHFVLNYFLYLSPQKETGIEDIEDLVKCFMESENRNYSLFNRINQINTEIESLEAENSHYKSMIEKYQDETQSDDQKKLRVFDVCLFFRLLFIFLFSCFFMIFCPHCLIVFYSNRI